MRVRPSSLRKALRISLTALALVVAVPAAALDDDNDNNSGATEANQFRFERQLRVNPFDPAALNNLAVVKAGQGRYEDARDLLERAARLAPESLEIRANLGRLMAWLNSAAGNAAAYDPPELSLSKVPPEPPRLWNQKLP